MARATIDRRNGMDVRARGLRRALGRFVALIVGFWMATVRVVLDDRGGHVHSKGRKVFAFLHGQQLGLLKLGHRRGLVTVVSHSLDGEMQARALGSLGFRIVRGSTSRGGAGALKGMVSEIRSGADAAIAVDGPRGPFGVPKPGAAFAAHATGASLVPLASASQNAIVLRRAWDRFEIPLPFSRVAVVVGEPVDAGAAASSPEVLASALSALRMRAEALASGKGFSS